MLQTNYFKLLKATDWAIHQYRVDFAPEEDRTAVRKGLLKLHYKSIGPYIFDGTVMYTSHRLPDVSNICMFSIHLLNVVSNWIFLQHFYK